MILAIRALRATIFAFNASTWASSVVLEEPPVIVTVAVPVFPPAIALIVVEAESLPTIRLAAVANAPATVVLLDGATTAPLFAASVTDVASATG